MLVLTAEEFQPDRRMFPSTMRIIRAPNDDAELTTHQAYTAEIASYAVARSLAAGRRVLVTCMAGRNRSGLVSALALTKLHGWSGDRATKRVQEMRQNALTNPSFVRYLASIPSGGVSS